MQLKELLLKVSLEDPALFHGKPEAEKCSFMAELGMKAADKSDKASTFFSVCLLLLFFFFALKLF